MKTIVQEGNEWFEYCEDGTKVSLGSGPAPAKEVEQVQREVKAKAETEEPKTSKGNDHSEADSGEDK